MTPYVADQDFTLYVGDALTVLQQLPDESVDCVVTSPPYWGLRDYGTGKWAGGDENCDHAGAKVKGRADYGFSEAAQVQTSNVSAGYTRYKDECPCGAQRVDQQLGLEPTPDQYVQRMVEVFREVRRVLAKHGTCWVNLGDSYAGSWGNQGRKEERGTQRPINGPMLQQLDGRYPQHESNTGKTPPGLKPKDLVGVPWRVAFALQADGWYLRSDIIWSKPNPMPESVTDRPTKAHEYVFLLTKQPRYWFDQEAVRERYQDGPGLNGGAYSPPGQSPHSNARGPDGRQKTTVLGQDGSIQHRDGERWPNGGRNIRSVWEIATQPYPETHFATFPEELARRCILAGCPVRVCRVCGKPSERIVERRIADVTKPRAFSKPGNHDRNDTGRIYEETVAHTLGWSDCGHNQYSPGIVLDPFLGSGTVALVARNHGRHAIGIELSAEYAELAAKRTRQLSLLAETPA